MVHIHYSKCFVVCLLLVVVTLVACTAPYTVVADRIKLIDSGVEVGPAKVLCTLSSGEERRGEVVVYNGTETDKSFSLATAGVVPTNAWVVLPVQELQVLAGHTESFEVHFGIPDDLDASSFELRFAVDELGADLDGGVKYRWVSRWLINN